jgi:hypothetical protein
MEKRFQISEQLELAILLSAFPIFNSGSIMSRLKIVLETKVAG